MPKKKDGLKPKPTKEQQKPIDADTEKEFLQGLKTKNEGFLVRCDLMQRERVAKWITDRFNDNKTKHKELSDNIDSWDETYRMVRKPMKDDDGEMPNYVMPLSTVALETIHANMMNVFFTPKDIWNVLPTEEGDIPKVKKLDIFSNWSAKNELHMFENIDRLFHSSAKNGECPYIVHWVKEYGTEIKREIVVNPANPQEPLYDSDTMEPIFQEIEEQKLLFNAPRLEIFSRKDYIQPESSAMGKTPEWEMRIIRMSKDEYLRQELQGKMYAGSIDDIKGWGDESTVDIQDKTDTEGDQIPMGRNEKVFIEFYGRMKIRVIKESDNIKKEEDDFEELEDEFIALVEPSGGQGGVLCSLRRNKFPLKMRPIGMDYFLPDDEGRRSGLGVMGFLEAQQAAYDALWNQYIFGVIQANNPIIFETPFGNKRKEAMRIRAGYVYPTSDANSVKIFNFPSPDPSINVALELVQSWAELLFGISAFAAGVESTIDPNAPAKKAELVVQQGNVRMNAVVKRKNATIQDIAKRWFLLYQANMPENKFMRVAGAGENAFEFNAVTLEDFALTGLPDFEITGNIINTNKALQLNKVIMIYNFLTQNPFFNPQTAQGMRALHSLTKWFIDKLDEVGLSSFLPSAPGEQIQTPEEENARFLQGDTGEPTPEDDDANHIQVHREFVIDPSIPEEIRVNVGQHINAHVEQIKQKIQQQLIMNQAGVPGGENVGQGQAGGQQVGGAVTEGAVGGMVPQQPAGMV